MWNNLDGETVLQKSLKLLIPATMFASNKGWRLKISHHKKEPAPKLPDLRVLQQPKSIDDIFKVLPGFHQSSCKKEKLNAFASKVSGLYI